MDQSIETLLAELYQSQSAKLLAVLTRLFGPQNWELAEEVLQEAFGKALVSWSESGIPDEPAAWIVQAAKNKAIDQIRANKTKTRFAPDLTQHLESEWSLGSTVEHEFQEHKIKDDQLRMIFMCCRDQIKPENRLPLILKTLCGFPLSAVARALVLPEETVKKRLHRTREQLKTQKFELPPADEMNRAMDTVHTVLYLLFNEGFHGSQAGIQPQLCQEAIGLLSLLTDEPKIVNRDTLGLFALMHFQLARASSKVDEQGRNIPIDLQDRSLWNQEFIKTGKTILNFSQKFVPGASSRFFVEACLAQEHCTAKSFEQTDWQKIVSLYGCLQEITQSPLVTLNRGIAMGYAGEIEQAIDLVESIADTKPLKDSPMPEATLAHLHAKAGRKKQAYDFAQIAADKGTPAHEHEILMRQIERLVGPAK